MMRTAKEILSPPVATAQTAAVYRFVAQLLPGARQQFLHVLSGGILRPALELDRLAQARQRPHGNAPGARVGAQQVADQEVATVEVLQVLVDNQADEQVTACSLLLFGRKLIERLRQHLIGGTVANLISEVLFNLSEGPRVTYRGAALGSHPHQLHLAAD